MCTGTPAEPRNLGGIRRSLPGSVLNKSHFAMINFTNPQVKKLAP